MSIRYVCNGHEFRYDRISGDVKNNYGTHVASLRFCKFTGIALLYRVTNHWPAIYPEDIIASLRGRNSPSAVYDYTDEQLAEFAIGHTAAAMPEGF